MSISGTRVTASPSTHVIFMFPLRLVSTLATSDTVMLYSFLAIHVLCGYAVSFFLSFIFLLTSLLFCRPVNCLIKFFVLRDCFKTIVFRILQIVTVFKLSGTAVMSTVGIDVESAR